jgi:ankyrin repeat protein
LRFDSRAGKKMSSANEKLRDAAKSGDVAEMERQIAAGANPNAFEGTGGWTPLQQAAMYGHIAAMAALLKAGARVDGVDSAGITALMVAAYGGHTAAVDALVAAGADVHRVNENGDTALHWASAWGHLDAARVLLEAGAKADVRNKDGKRPIDLVRVPLARSLRLSDCFTSLPRRVPMRRFARAPTSPTRPPCARCWSGRPP